MVVFSQIGSFSNASCLYNGLNLVNFLNTRRITMRNEKLQKTVLVGLFAALSYAVFTICNMIPFFHITLPGGSATTIHFANAVCVIAALMLGGFYGGLAGAIGMTIADLFDPAYILYAPKTFILKLCIGLITGLIAHKIGHITTEKNVAKVRAYVILASIGALAFNVIFDPLTGYFYKLLILGKPAAEVALVWDIGSTSINAFVSVIASVLIYMSIRPTLMKTGNFFILSKK